eukprot:6466323-Amphidinium_carterae.2
MHIGFGYSAQQEEAADGEHDGVRMCKGDSKEPPLHLPIPPRNLLGLKLPLLPGILWNKTDEVNKSPAQILLNTVSSVHC